MEDLGFMPTYEYRCPQGHHFELFQKMSDEPRAPCPECGAVSERVISGGAGFLFKGEGFYITDYRGEDYKKEASKEKGAAAESPSEGEKPAAKKPDTDKGGKAAKAGTEGSSSGEGT